MVHRHLIDFLVRFKDSQVTRQVELACLHVSAFIQLRYLHGATNRKRSPRTGNSHNIEDTLDWDPLPHRHKSNRHHAAVIQILSAATSSSSEISSFSSRQERHRYVYS